MNIMLFKTSILLVVSLLLICPTTGQGHEQQQNATTEARKRGDERGVSQTPALSPRIPPRLRASAVAFQTTTTHPTSNHLRLWYASPAEKWDDAMPIGSGRLGAMIFGQVPDERIQFNEDTLWTGEPHDYVRAGAFDHLAEIRSLIFAGKQKEAEDLARKTFLSDPVRQKAYQPFGDLHFHFPHHDHPPDYHRELDLNDAVASVTYRIGDVTFHRDAFASYPDNAIIIHLASSKPNQITFTLKMDSPHKNSSTRKIAPDVLALRGHVIDPKNHDKPGLRFESRLQIRANGGKTTLTDNEVSVDHANNVTLLLVCSTSFKNFQDISADPSARCAQYLDHLRGKNYDDLLQRHLADYHGLFNRVALDLGHSKFEDLPTDQRLDRLRKSGDPVSYNDDPALDALFFQFGRYLLISSSRPGTQPANLQGIWNEKLDPPWESKYTTNINLEMNYWPAEPTNLSQCADPLFDLIDDLTISGHRTAKEQYNAGGWVLHHNTDEWRGTAPINNIDGIWPTGGAWLSYHLWEHYLFTQDINFLAKRAYPAMKGASIFFLDSLVKDPKTGWLVTNPSFSPEQGGLCAGPAMDMQLIRALFDSTIESARILGTDKTADKDLIARIIKTRKQLAPDQVGKHGQLQEWLQDVDQPNNNHRHMSPLWGLFPGSEFTPQNPQLFAAAKVLLKWRGDGSTGWSFAWRIPLWARVHEGQHAYRELQLQLAKRTLPSLLDLCGPFQIDGNFGATAGIAEMLLQSHIRPTDDPHFFKIELLPALPNAWADGSVTGLCARGGFVLDMTWKNGKLTIVKLHSEGGNPCRLQAGNHSIDLKTGKGKTYTFDGDLNPKSPIQDSK
jgi:alpha-L-fucosidase 2